MNTTQNDLILKILYWSDSVEAIKLWSFKVPIQKDIGHIKYGLPVASVEQT